MKRFNALTLAFCSLYAVGLGLLGYSLAVTW